MEDSTIITQLFERAETGLEQLAAKYKGLILGIMNGVLGNSADAEECYNDLLMAVWNSIPPQKPDSLTAYLCTLSRRIAINKYRYNNRQKRRVPYDLMLSELDEAIPDTAIREESDSERIVEVLNTFVGGLDAETRVLFLRRYVYAESVTELSRRFDMSEDAVASRLYRARRKLKRMLREENIEL